MSEPSWSRVVQEHRGRGRVRLDVVDLVTEPLEADQVMHRLPDDAGDRHPGHHAEQDDLLPGGDVQANCSLFSDGDGPSERHHRPEGRCEPTADLGALGVRRGLGVGAGIGGGPGTPRETAGADGGRASSEQSIRCI